MISHDDSPKSYDCYWCHFNIFIALYLVFAVCASYFMFSMSFSMYILVSKNANEAQIHDQLIADYDIFMTLDSNLQMETAFMRYLSYNSSDDLIMYESRRDIALASAVKGMPSKLFRIIEQTIRDRILYFDQLLTISDYLKSLSNTDRQIVMAPYLNITATVLEVMNSNIRMFINQKYRDADQLDASNQVTHNISAALIGSNIILVTVLFIVYHVLLRRGVVQLVDSKKLLSIETELLAEKIKLVNELENSRKDFTLVFAHELKTPINGALGMIQLVMESVMPEEQRLYLLSLCVESLYNMNLAVDDMLDFKALENQRVTELQLADERLLSEMLLLENSSSNSMPIVTPFSPIMMEPVHINLVISELVAKYQRRMALKNIKLISDMLNIDSIAQWVVTNKPRLMQLLDKLLNNAFKFTDPNGHVRLVAHSTPFTGFASVPNTHSSSVDVSHVSGKSVCLCFDVIDDGIGIAPDKLLTIFTPFSTLDKSLTRPTEGGLGLGLVICKFLAHQLGGTLKATSVLGQGTRMSLEITVDVANNQSPAGSATILPHRKSEPEKLGSISTTPHLITHTFVVAVGSSISNPASAKPLMFPSSGYIANSPFGPNSARPIIAPKSAKVALVPFLPSVVVVPVMPEHLENIECNFACTPSSPPPMSTPLLCTEPIRAPRLVRPSTAVSILRRSTTKPPPLPSVISSLTHVASTASFNLAKTRRMSQTTRSGPDDGLAMTGLGVITRVLDEDTLAPRVPRIVPQSSPESRNSNANTPTFISTSAAYAASLSAGAATPHVARSLHVLIAEDSNINQVFVMGVLRQLGHTFLMTVNGQLALDAVKAYWNAVEASADDTVKILPRKFDICLMDISMPVMDGLAAVVAIRAFEAEDPSRRHKLPIIACTAHNEKIMESNIYASGMQNVVLKPIMKTELVAKMNALVDHFDPERCGPKLPSTICIANDENTQMSSTNSTLYHTTVTESVPVLTDESTRLEFIGTNPAKAIAVVVSGVPADYGLKNGNRTPSSVISDNPPLNIAVSPDRSLHNALATNMPAAFVSSIDDVSTSLGGLIHGASISGSTVREKPQSFTLLHRTSILHSMDTVMTPVDEVRIEMDSEMN